VSFIAAAVGNFIEWYDSTSSEAWARPSVQFFSKKRPVPPFLSTRSRSSQSGSDFRAARKAFVFGRIGDVAGPEVPLTHHAQRDGHLHRLDRCRPELKLGQDRLLPR